MKVSLQSVEIPPSFALETVTCEMCQSMSANLAEKRCRWGQSWILTFITKKGGHGQSGQFYATLAAIIFTQSGQEAHIALPINPVNNFFITSPNDRATPGARGFSDLVILEWICRVNLYIEGYNLRCEMYLSQLLCGIHLSNIQNFHTSHDHFGF